MPVGTLMPGTDVGLATSVAISSEAPGIPPPLISVSRAQTTSSAGWPPEPSTIGEETQVLLLEDTERRFYRQRPWSPRLRQSGRLVFGDRCYEEQGPRLISLVNGDRGRSKVTLPRLEGLGIQDPILTDSVRKLLRVLWSIVVSRALQGSFPLHSTAVAIFEDPSEDERKALLRVVCRASAAQAIAFWDSLDLDLQAWLRRLNDRDRTTFLTTISLRVHWV